MVDTTSVCSLDNRLAAGGPSTTIGSAPCLRKGRAPRMLIKYLWKNRRRVSFGSPNWCKTWSKRIVTMPTLLKTSLRQQRLRNGGAKFEDPIFIAPSRFQGKFSWLNIGRGSFIGRVSIHLHSTIEIGRDVVINDGVVLMTATHDIKDAGWSSVSKPIAIGDHAWIATNALILPGVTIGCGAVVGAGAVVARDVPRNAVAIGNPAQITENGRATELHYKPTSFLPLFRAWLAGPES